VAGIFQSVCRVIESLTQPFVHAGGITPALSAKSAETQAHNDI
jgi:hypothetical protein